MMRSTAVVLLCLLPLASAIPIDNGVQGEPEISCGATGITIQVNTQNGFEGNVYVKNRFAEDGCRVAGDGRQVASIELGFDQCGTVRERSLEPRGVFVRQTVVVSFHPRFITKIDRAYTVQCFYMEADKTVSTEIEVSMITTAFQTQLVPMPVCRYEILDAAENGNVVQFAIIGQAVFHKWTCDTDTVDTFCAVVHSCTVDDGAGDSLQLLDENGCALDKYLLGNLEYPMDLMAIKEVHVFKYQDRPALFFNCQISISIKEPGQECARPQCAEPGGSRDGSGSGVVRRFRRSADAGITDVSSGIEALDISAADQQMPALRSIERPIVLGSAMSGDYCVSTTAFTGMLVMLGLVVLGGVVAFALRSNGKF